MQFRHMNPVQKGREFSDAAQMAGYLVKIITFLRGTLKRTFCHAGLPAQHGGGPGEPGAKRDQEDVGAIEQAAFGLGFVQRERD